MDFYRKKTPWLRSTHACACTETSCAWASFWLLYGAPYRCGARHLLIGRAL